MARGGVWKTHLRLQVICDSKHFLWGIQSAKKSAMTRYDYLNTVQSIHLNFHVWLQDPWLFWMCLLVGDSSGVGRTMCVTATLWFTCLFVFFHRLLIFHISHLLPLSLLLSGAPAGQRKIHDCWPLLCPKQTRSPSHFSTALDKTALECESVTRLMNPWRSCMSPHSLKEVSPWIISNQLKFRMAFC